MVEKNLNIRFTEVVLAALEETFENSGRMYLDSGTSLFETLATITAEEASRPTSVNCATVAAHAAHLSLSIEVVMKYIRGERPQVDWMEIWRTVREVTPEEWESSQKQLREAYNHLRTLVTNVKMWEGEVGLILSTLMHNAYHLGEIRHALCTIKAEN